MSTSYATKTKTNTTHTSHLSLRAKMRLFGLLLLLLVGFGNVSAQKEGDPIIAKGIVYLKNQRTGAVTTLEGALIANITNKGIQVYSRNNGTFEIRAFVGDKIQITHLDRAMGGRTFTVKDTSVIKVELNSNEDELSEVQIEASQEDVKDEAEPAEGQIRGNYYIVQTTLKFQDKKFHNNHRLVLQPVYYDATTKRSFYMPPRVIDGREYNQTQDRLYAFEMEKEGNDTLAPFVDIKTRAWLRDNKSNNKNLTTTTGEKRKKSKKKVIDILEYVYTDSIYIDNPNDARAKVNGLMWREDYTHIFQMDTTVMSNGMTNTLRWLDYSLGSTFVTDEELYPKKQLGLRRADEGLNLRFDVGKYNLNTEEPQNKAEITKLVTTINNIASMPSAKIYSLQLAGKSSPEGNYAHNLELSRKRMESTKAFISSQLPSNLKNTKFQKPIVEVAKWEEVVELMRRDSLDTEADQVQEVIDKYKDINYQGRAIRQLPFYAKIDSVYLPRLRTVTCVMRYDMSRELTLDEIKGYYAQDPNQLVDADLFKFYRDSSTPDSVKEKILEYTTKRFPDEPIFANDYSAILIKNGKPNPNVLSRFIGDRAEKTFTDQYKHKPGLKYPKFLAQNQMAALLGKDKLKEAYSLKKYVPKNDSTRVLLAICGVRNGYYKNYFKDIETTGPRNTIALLLQMDTKDVTKAERAYELCNEMDDSLALTHYFRAMACSRIAKKRTGDESLDFMDKAENEVKKALKMDPTLIEDAIYSYDLNGLDYVKNIIEKREEEERAAAENAAKGIAK